MSEENQTCPKCQSSYAYPDGSLWICPECFHEWTLDNSDNTTQDLNPFMDVNGTPLVDGDSVTLVKDLKLGKDILKSGTKVKNIKLLDQPVNDHDISCKIPGFGSAYLKCSVVKKSK
ncbi:MAG: alkylphosphonate utilization protein [Bdellovibrionaceae bacterium]|nr:alkylphosphonate utilization protein [Pseudobdellovibrionaceae bacterium]|tara:strand:+ start:1403 stop:1753 length:351 start_codon:yes stop_codon:yes gene_type:complete